MIRGVLIEHWLGETLTNITVQILSNLSSPSPNSITSFLQRNNFLWNLIFRFFWMFRINLNIYRTYSQSFYIYHIRYTYFSNKCEGVFKMRKTSILRLQDIWMSIFNFREILFGKVRSFMFLFAYRRYHASPTP